MSYVTNMGVPRLLRLQTSSKKAKPYRLKIFSSNRRLTISKPLLKKNWRIKL